MAEPSPATKAIDAFAGATLIMCIVFAVDAVVEGMMLAALAFIAMGAGCGLLLRSRLNRRNQNT